MGIQLGQSTVFLPDVPRGILSKDPELYSYLQSFRKEMINAANGFFGNDLLMATAMNLGTSGTFVISSGGSIVVTSGIVVSVTS